MSQPKADQAEENVNYPTPSASSTPKMKGSSKKGGDKETEKEGRGGHERYATKDDCLKDEG